MTTVKWTSSGCIEALAPIAGVVVLKKALLVALALSLVTALGLPASAQRQGAKRTYVVVYEDAASLEDARAAIDAAGGTVVRENAAVGVATVTSTNVDFRRDVSRQEALFGAARNLRIGGLEPAKRDKVDLERLTKARKATMGQKTSGDAQSAVEEEPLADLQWDMEMINATADGSYAAQPGNPGVLVGIIDTGVDATHPDIAPNFNESLSRNFTTDIPLVDGKCNQEPDKSCSDPANVDENGHGTHVAGTVASPINGLGMAGVAPNVTVANLRAGQDSGFFFLQASVDALTFAADNGFDVVNMSYYIDPWLYNCGTASPSPQDNPAATMEQQTIIEGTQRAVDYAFDNGVSLIGASGNEHTDLGNPTFDPTSPDFPPGAAYDREVTNGCLDMPTEANHVMSINALGPSERKSYYSNYGVEQSTVAAPGGDFRDFFGTDRTRTPGNLILAPYPESLAKANKEINGQGKPKTPFVVRDCTGKSKDTCAYYQYLQGTSMASPHAVGVAALIVSEFGAPEAGGLGMSPASVQTVLQDSARDHACPAGGVLDYPDEDLGDEFTATCVGTAEFNGFYGHGIVDALSAVTP